MKGFTAEKLHIYLVILIIISGGYLALPEIRGVTQPNTTQLVCPVTLNNELYSYITLENKGTFSASFNVDFTSDKIKFINDHGEVIDNLNIKYGADPDKEIKFNFKPIFSANVNNTYIQIIAKCEGLCKPFRVNRCCYYTLDANNLKLDKEINGRCK